MSLKEIYNNLDKAHTHYEFACREFETEIYNRFDYNVTVIHQYGDGFVIVWEDEYDVNNSLFNIDELSKLKSKEEFLEYLKYNSI